MVPHLPDSRCRCIPWALRCYSYISGRLRCYILERLRWYISGRLPGRFPGHMPTFIKDQLVFGRFEQPVMGSKTPRGPDFANNLSGSLADTFPVMTMIGGG